jgi:hypothetical protein
VVGRSVKRPTVHVVSSRVYEDWHRVERARDWFQRAVGRLERDGWTVEA